MPEHQRLAIDYRLRRGRIARGKFFERKVRCLAHVILNPCQHFLSVFRPSPFDFLKQMVG